MALLIGHIPKKKGSRRVKVHRPNGTQVDAIIDDVDKTRSRVKRNISYWITCEKSICMNGREDTKISVELRYTPVGRNPLTREGMRQFFSNRNAPRWDRDGAMLMCYFSFCFGSSADRMKMFVVKDISGATIHSCQHNSAYSQRNETVRLEPECTAGTVHVKFCTS